MKNLKLAIALLAIVVISQNISPIQAQTIPKIKIGSGEDYIQFSGALRFNYIYSNWQKQNKKKGGEFGYEVFYLGLDGLYKKILFSMQYRIYGRNLGGGMLSTGYTGYKFNDRHQIQLGLNAVPFGPLPYNSHNWFLSINYYLGLENDADMGVKYSYTGKDWDVDLAFYKNSDLLDFNSESNTNTSRFSYDVGGRNKETNQGNLRVIRKWGKQAKQQLGVSVLTGGIYNIDTKRMGFRATAGIHYNLDYKNWNLKLMALSYKINPRPAKTIVDSDGNPIANPDSDGEIVTLAAYDAPYNIASAAEVYTAGLSYKIPIDKGPFGAITIYNDFGYLHKHEKSFNDSFQNVTGASFEIGPVLIFLDNALGKNHPWLGPEWTHAFASGGSQNTWNYRFNLNIGYYF